ncbi:hypothetical protein ATANTOWER_028668, partial [Ataeniobius toweri]|nr:hypothetical protein [Ataeniobius toweri]
DTGHFVKSGTHFLLELKDSWMWTHSPGNSHLKVNNPPSCHSPSLSLEPGTQTYPENGITYLLDILYLLLRAYLPPKSL